jgi:hypothetical protein
MRSGKDSRKSIYCYILKEFSISADNPLPLHSLPYQAHISDKGHNSNIKRQIVHISVSHHAKFWENTKYFENLPFFRLFEYTGCFSFHSKENMHSKTK